MTPIRMTKRRNRINERNIYYSYTFIYFEIILGKIELN